MFFFEKVCDKLSSSIRFLENTKERNKAKEIEFFIFCFTMESTNES